MDAGMKRLKSLSGLGGMGPVRADFVIKDGDLRMKTGEERHSTVSA
jgi:hypothetical protein